MANKSELLLQLLDDTGFDSPKHALNYASKASEKFKSAPSAKQYRALTRALWNAKPKNKQELFNAMMARLDAKPSPSKHHLNFYQTEEQINKVADNLLKNSQNPETDYAYFYQDATDFLNDKDYLKRLGEYRAKDVAISQKEYDTSPKTRRFSEDELQKLKKQYQDNNTLSGNDYKISAQEQRLIDDILENSWNTRNKRIEQEINNENSDLQLFDQDDPSINAFNDDKMFMSMDDRIQDWIISNKRIKKPLTEDQELLQALRRSIYDKSQRSDRLRTRQKK